MQNQPYKTVLAVVSDLFFSAKITEAAKRAGVTLEYITTEKALFEKAKANPALIIFDLEFRRRAASPADRQADKGDAVLKHISLLGYLSHVQSELKAKAQETGWRGRLPPVSAFIGGEIE